MPIRSAGRSKMELSMELKTVVSMCETQPITVIGLQHLFSTTEDLSFGEAYQSILHWTPRSGVQNEILLVDKIYGAQNILDGLAHLRTLNQAPFVVIWGTSLKESEPLRYLQAGAHGILSRTAELPVLLACLRSVAQGKSWMQNSLFRDIAQPVLQFRSELTPREQEVMRLVEQGYKNREIAEELGIRPGTVKIHLKHVFEKTGIRGRHGIALNGLREKGVVSLLTS